MNRRERFLIQRCLSDIQSGNERGVETLAALCGSVELKTVVKRRKPRSATKKRTGKDPDYLSWLHTLPCCVDSHVHTSRIEAAHLGPRGLSTKAPDRQAVPMCGGHHKGLHMFGPKGFWEKHRQDWREVIEKLNAEYEKRSIAA